MAGRDLSLTSRVEAVRETRRIPAPVLFSSEEIYNHFYESLTHIKEQFMVPMAKVEIAHQNDRDHATAIQNNISKEFVEDYIQKIENIVNGIHTIIKEKDSELEELL